MPQGGKDELNKANDPGPIGKPADGNNTFGEALSKTGFVPANVGRKIVSQGRRRETLKRSAPRDSDK